VLSLDSVPLGSAPQVEGCGASGCSHAEPHCTLDSSASEVDSRCSTPLISNKQMPQAITQGELLVGGALCWAQHIKQQGRPVGCALGTTVAVTQQQQRAPNQQPTFPSRAALPLYHRTQPRQPPARSVANPTRLPLGAALLLQHTPGQPARGCCGCRSSDHLHHHHWR